ncbi:MAG: L-2-amino-thiazoline-4-carboxylic acid hydrolase [Pseudomonadota bacterium]
MVSKTKTTPHTNTKIPQDHPNPHLYAAIKERGRIYLEIFRELSKRHGQSEAVSVLRAASHAHGTAVGEKLAHLAPRDFAGMVEGYALTPDRGVTYSTEVRELTESCLEFKNMTCPLKESWEDAGCSDEEICTLLHCASAWDQAALTAAGFDFELELWAPGREGCCRTRLTEKAAR